MITLDINMQRLDFNICIMHVTISEIKLENVL